MKGRIAAIVAGLLLASSTVAGDGEPEWLPAPQPRPPVWDTRPDGPAPPTGQDFGDLLRYISRPESDLGSQVDPSRVKLNRESTFDLGRVKSSVDGTTRRVFRPPANRFHANDTRLSLRFRLI